MHDCDTVASVAAVTASCAFVRPERALLVEKKVGVRFIFHLCGGVD